MFVFGLHSGVLCLSPCTPWQACPDILILHQKHNVDGAKFSFLVCFCLWWQCICSRYIWEVRGHEQPAVYSHSVLNAYVRLVEINAPCATHISHKDLMPETQCGRCKSLCLFCFAWQCVVFIPMHSVTGKSRNVNFVPEMRCGWFKIPISSLCLWRWCMCCTYIWKARDRKQISITFL